MTKYLSKKNHIFYKIFKILNFKSKKRSIQSLSRISIKHLKMPLSIINGPIKYGNYVGICFQTIKTRAFSTDKVLFELITVHLAKKS